MAGADVAAEHERCGAIGPAFKDIWAPRFLTNRVQVQAFDQLEQVILVRRIAQTNPQPIGFWLTRLWVQDSEFAGQSDLPHLIKNILASARRIRHLRAKLALYSPALEKKSHG